MKFEELWIIIENKNTNLKNDKEVRMTINGFRKALKTAYDQGYDAGYVEGAENGTGGLNVFEQMFGRKG